MSKSASEGPLAVELLISVARFTVPSRFISMTCTAPRSAPPSSSSGAPAARSGMPSPSTSPMPAVPDPNRLELPTETRVDDDALTFAAVSTAPLPRAAEPSSPIT